MKAEKVLLTVNIIRSGNGLATYKQFRNIQQLINEIPSSLIVNLQLQAAVEVTVPQSNGLASIPAHVTILPYDADNNHRNMLASTLGEYVVFIEDGYVTPNFIKEAMHAVHQNTHPRFLLPEALTAYGLHNQLIDLNKESGMTIAKLMHDSKLPLTVPFVVNRREYNDPAYGPIQILGRLLGKGYQIGILPGTLYFYEYNETTSLAKPGLIVNNIFYPDIFLNLVPSTLTAKTASPAKAGKVASISVKMKMADYIKQRSPLVHQYLKNQYILNREFAAITSKGAIKRLKKQNIEDVSENIVVEPLKNSPLSLAGSTFLEQWSRLNVIEPMIRPTQDILKSIQCLDNTVSSEFINRYLRFCSLHKESKFTDIIMVPHLVRGGADLAALSLISCLAAQGRRVLVIVSLEVESPWAHKVQEIEGATLFEAKDWFSGIEEEYRAAFIARVIIQWGVKHLSVINSALGYRMLQDYGSIIGTNCLRLLHTYAFDMTEDGFLYNVLRNGLVETYDSLDFYITDTLVYKNQLHEIYGFEKDKIKALYLPVSSEIKQKKDYLIKKKVLWASRINDSKLVEVMVEIGKILSKNGIELHIFGVLDDYYSEQNRFVSMIGAYNDIHYHGAYDGFASIDVDQYDIFLMTSKNEGMPNVILEACVANVYIVAPPLGGIPECITQGVNGALVSNKFDPEAYAGQILSAYKDCSFTRQGAIASHNKVMLARHTRESYERNVRKIVGIA